MNKINIGTKVAPLGIPKCKLAAGQVGRAVLIDPNPQFKYIAYDNDKRVRVEVDQDAVIKYGLKPTTTYFYLLAIMNTDRMGNVVPGPIEIQYLQVSESVNNDFSDAVNNMTNFSSLQLNAVEKVTSNGTFSYVKPIPCNNIQIPQDVLEQVNRYRSNPAAVEAMWKIIDASTSITVQAYEKLLQSPAQLPQPTQNPPIPQAPSSPMLSSYQQPQGGYQPLPPIGQAPAPQAQPVQPVVETPADNDFGAGDDFGEDFDSNPA